MPAGTGVLQKNGYGIIWELDNIPDGNKKYHLIKDLFASNDTHIKK